MKLFTGSRFVLVYNMTGLEPDQMPDVAFYDHEEVATDCFRMMTGKTMVIDTLTEKIIASKSGEMG